MHHHLLSAEVLEMSLEPCTTPAVFGTFYTFADEVAVFAREDIGDETGWEGTVIFSFNPFVGLFLACILVKWLLGLEWGFWEAGIDFCSGMLAMRFVWENQRKLTRLIVAGCLVIYMGNLIQVTWPPRYSEALKYWKMLSPHHHDYLSGLSGRVIQINAAQDRNILLGRVPAIFERRPPRPSLS